MKNIGQVKPETVLFQTAGIFLDYSEKSILIWDENESTYVLYPKSEVVVDHNQRIWGTIDSVYKNSLSFTQRNFSNSYFKNIIDKKPEFSYENCI